ncbi:MAG TPA: tRNA dihydrouridine synthase DusB, partial [Haliea salexigens]|nr:tRNA dihydrouridine synthase DusB [Haliea salexigens]
MAYHTLLPEATSQSPPMPRIGPYTLTNAVALAPMAGVTDLP